MRACEHREPPAYLFLTELSTHWPPPTFSEEGPGTLNKGTHYIPSHRRFWNFSENGKRGQSQFQTKITESPNPSLSPSKFSGILPQHFHQKWPVLLLFLFQSHHTDSGYMMGGAMQHPTRLAWLWGADLAKVTQNILFSVARGALRFKHWGSKG